MKKEKSIRQIGGCFLMPHIDEHSGNDFETVTNPD